MPAKTHGMRKSREYTCWLNMRARCNNPKTRGYERYGAVGVRVCQQWETSFEQFIKDMGVCPGPHHEIDRIKSDRGYEPGNCRWVTEQEQAENRSIVRWFIIDGNRLTLTGVARKYGMSVPTLKHRIDVQNMSVEQAVSEPIKNVKVIEYNGQSKHLFEWAKLLNIAKNVLIHRLKRGWTVERAFTQKVQEKGR